MSYTHVSESRFYMWRAVFAMAHVDGQVSADEILFAEQYLDKAPFSKDQKDILKQDLKEPQNVSELLAKVDDLSDQADFFQFSHMLAWTDGDYSSQEQNLLNRLSSLQQEKANKDLLAANLREARRAAILRRAVEDERFEEQAKDVSGFANVLRFVLPWMEMHDFDPPDSEMFKLWRAVFSLVHADDDVDQAERDYVHGMMEVFHFSQQQKEIVKEDLEYPKDTLELFKALKNTRHRKQFFVMARTIIWCDGIFHDKEKEIIERIENDLGDDKALYENELRWIARRPDLDSEMGGAQKAPQTPQETVMKNVVRQMIDFYKQLETGL